MFKCVLEVVCVVHFSSGPQARKLVMIVVVIGQNMALKGGLCTLVRRQAMPFIQVSDFILKFLRNVFQKYIPKACKKTDIHMNRQPPDSPRRLMSEKAK